MADHDFDHDFVIVGSGFGGSAMALRLCEKGYDVLVLEKGSQLGPKHFPKTNWNIPKWMWMPWAGFRGLFKMTFFKHVTVLSGVGVGGGSLTYACTHPVPKATFFTQGSWAGMADWRTELAPHYDVAKRMLGVNAVPFKTKPDKILQSIAEDRGKPEEFHPTEVAVYFGEPGKEVDDPYFDGRGPTRTGCNRCGGCMLGCRHGAKNTLDKNYLHLAKQLGMTLHADTEVTAIRPLPGGGYRIEAKLGRRMWMRKKVSYTAKQVVLAGGVLGTVDLLLKMKEDPEGLPKLSKMVGAQVRTNSEALIGVVAPGIKEDLSKGVAIGSIFQTDDISHIEVVRYPEGSGFFRTMTAPLVEGESKFVRLARTIGTMLRHPVTTFKGYFIGDMSKQSVILLYMRTAAGTLRFKRAWHGGMTTATEAGEAPTANIPEAKDLAEAFAEKMNGMPVTMITETLMSIPTTAHILGGAVIGDSPDTGVIDADHKVYGYDGLFVVDGASVSANPGVNPSLTILAMAERAASKIPAKRELDEDLRLPSRAEAAIG